MTSKWLLLAIALAFGAVGGYLWLALWADERNQRFYLERERVAPTWARIG